MTGFRIPNPVEYFSVPPTYDCPMPDNTLMFWTKPVKNVSQNIANRADALNIIIICFVPKRYAFIK